MDNYFIHCSSCTAFEIFRSDPFTYVLRIISGEDEVKMLTAPRLNKFTQVEWNVFKKHSQKEVNDHYIEAKSS